MSEEENSEKLQERLLQIAMTNLLNFINKLVSSADSKDSIGINWDEATTYIKFLLNEIEGGG